MESSKKILNNCDVLESIFLYLDFKEHLKLIKICPQFKDAILHGVWHLKCKNLHIMQALPDTFLLQYNAVNNVKREWPLTPAAIHLILHHSSMCIRKLELNNIHNLKSIISLKYQNLIELSLCKTVVEDTHLKQVAENCLNLKSLTLLSFKSPKSKANVRANVFGEMKNLNKLEISDISFTAWNYFDVQQLFYLAHLKTLSINIKIRDSNDNKGNNNNSIDRANNIVNLTIGELPCQQSANVCFREDLIRFQNLTKLTIIVNRVSIDDDVLTQINNACPKLCELSFTECYFRFKEFPRMNNLMHLTFESCKNIRLRDFDEIFRKLKLKSLSLVDVRRVTCMYEHVWDYNYISNTLEILNIRDIYDEAIVSIFHYRQHKFENVSKIRLFHSRIFHPQLTGLCFSHNFPNLQELIMDSYHISSEDILYLEHLKVLQFHLFDNMFWSYLEILFKHPTLTHITITPFSCRDFKKHYKRFPISCEGLTTILEYLSLPSSVYEGALSFWPSFRQRNKLLKLEIADSKTLKSSAVPMR